jgi:hypothetical protein
MVTGVTQLQEVAKIAQRRHGQSHGLAFHALRLADRVLTGLPRRVKGAWKLLSLYRKADFAFEVKMDPLPESLKRQFLTRSYFDLLRDE